MPGLFQGLEIGKRALLSHQITLQTIGHNIANVETPGYTRQRVRISSTSPEELTYGSVGTGIGVDDVRHIRDLFLGQQYREANKALGEWTKHLPAFRNIDGEVFLFLLLRFHGNVVQAVQ